MPKPGIDIKQILPKTKENFLTKLKMVAFLTEEAKKHYQPLKFDLKKFEKSKTKLKR